ncbi:MAG TPA: ABC transporter substrate-binding protein [Acetobacteraceae bacterium]|nr:ABC transporter substrate-binding protein [Acetobacteraceae bacterium]
MTLVAVCLMPLPVGAADTTGASDAVTELNAGLLAQMKAGRAVPFATRYAQLAPLIERVFDLPAILTASVGLRWAELPQDDQTQLLDVFRSYTVSSYVANFDHDGGQRFVTLPDTRSVGEQVVVATQIVPLSGAPARIDYVLRPENGEGRVLWKATDIMLDGSISQVAVQRSEFYGLLRNGGVANLIATLRRKTADLSGGELSRPAGNAASGTPG